MLFKSKVGKLLFFFIFQLVVTGCDVYMEIPDESLQGNEVYVFYENPPAGTSSTIKGEILDVPVTYQDKNYNIAFTGLPDGVPYLKVFMQNDQVAWPIDFITRVDNQTEETNKYYFSELNRGTIPAKKPDHFTTELTDNGDGSYLLQLKLYDEANLLVDDNTLVILQDTSSTSIFTSGSPSFSAVTLGGGISTLANTTDLSGLEVYIGTRKISGSPQTRPNTAPSAVADYYNARYNVDPGMPFIVDAPGVLANDEDGDGDLLTADLVQQTVGGQVYLETNGSFSYYPYSGFRGADTFSYVADDGFAHSEETTVHLFVYDALSIDQVTAMPGDEITVPVRITSAGDVSGLQFDVSFDSTYLSLESVQAGELLPTVQGDVYGSFDYESLGNGHLRFIVANLGNVNIKGEAGILLNLVFQIDSTANTLNDGDLLNLNLDDYIMTNSRGQNLTGQFTAVDGWVKLHVDKEPPKISFAYTPDPSGPLVHVDVSVDGTGSDVKSLKVSKGIHDINHFKTEGTEILAEKTFDIDENTTYSIYAKDEAGNEAVKLVQVMGDVNFSRVVDVTDWVEVINYILERQIPTPAQFMVADMNQDHELNVIDPILVADRIMAGGH